MLQTSRLFCWLCLLQICFAECGVSNLCSAQELSRKEREQVVLSFQEYQSTFREKKVGLEARIRNDFRPAESSGPVWHDLRIAAANAWIYVEQDIGVIHELSGKVSKATFARKSVYDSRNGKGLETIVRDDGEMVQAVRVCRPIIIQHFSNRRLVQALGWLSFGTFGAGDLIDPVSVLKEAESIRREIGPGGDAKLVAFKAYGDGLEVEFHFSDLPVVRMVQLRKTFVGVGEATGEVFYKIDSDGFYQPSGYREVRTRTDVDPPRIELFQEAVITRFKLSEVSPTEQMPKIEIPEGLEVRDDCERAKKKAQTVPVPVPTDDSKP